MRLLGVIQKSINKSTYRILHALIRVRKGQWIGQEIKVHVLQLFIKTPNYGTSLCLS